MTEGAEGSEVVAIIDAPPAEEAGDGRLPAPSSRRGQSAAHRRSAAQVDR
jgi:hypothetical protein